MIKQIGFDRYYSTVTKSEHSSREAAEHYENEERIRSRARADAAGQDKLNSLSADELKELINAVTVQANENAGIADHDNAAKEFFAAHEEIVAEGPVGYANGRALFAYLRGQGVPLPFSRQNFEDAYEVLAPTGSLALSGEPKIFNEELAMSLSLDELRQKANASMIRRNGR
jgi:hypothetical protein